MSKTYKVVSAVIVAGRIKRPGEEVELSAADGKALAQRGKVEEVKGAAEVEGDEGEGEGGEPTAKSGAKRGAAKKAADA